MSTPIVGGSYPHGDWHIYIHPTKLCPTCGEEIDADDEGCPDDGDTA